MKVYEVRSVAEFISLWRKKVILHQAKEFYNKLPQVIDNRKLRGKRIQKQCTTYL